VSLRGRTVLLATLLLAFALVLLAVELRWGPLHRLDLRVADELNRIERRHPAQVTWWKWVSRVLYPDVLRIAAAIAAVALWLGRRRGAALLVVVAMAGAAALEVTVKALVGRDRPVFAEPVAHAPGAAFPSGHAITATVAFGLLVVLVPARHRVAAALAAAGAVALVSFSRLALGVHYLTDVAGAWLLGLACLVAAHWTVSRRSAPATAPRDPGRPRGTPAC
jgi:membrane-associated phospholipid phosphatase